MSQQDLDRKIDTLKAFAEQRMSVTPAKFDTTEVTIDAESVVLVEYKAELYASWDSVASMRGYDLGFTSDDLSKYIDMLISQRIDYTRGLRVLVKPVDGFAVPAYLSLLLSNIGLARNTDLGIELVPVMKQDVNVDLAFMTKMSRLIRNLSHMGVEYAEGYTRSRDGGYDFMSMSMLDEHVYNTVNTIHPVYALMASTLGVRGIETVLSPRVNYGSVAHMTSLIRHLAQTKG